MQAAVWVLVLIMNTSNGGTSINENVNSEEECLVHVEELKKREEAIKVITKSSELVIGCIKK